MPLTNTQIAELLLARTEDAEGDADAVFEEIFDTVDGFWQHYHTINNLLAWASQRSNAERLDTGAILACLRLTAGMRPILTRWKDARDEFIRALASRNENVNALLNGLRNDQEVLDDFLLARR